MNSNQDNNTHNNGDVNLKEFFDIFYRDKLLIFLFTLLTTSCGIFYS